MEERKMLPVHCVNVVVSRVPSVLGCELVFGAHAVFSDMLHMHSILLGFTVSNCVFLRAALLCHCFLPVMSDFSRYRSCSVWFLLHNGSLKLLMLLAWIFSIYVFLRLFWSKTNVVSSSRSHHGSTNCTLRNTNLKLLS